MADNFYSKYSANSGGGAGGGVTSVNGLSGALTLAAGSGITLTPVGNTITIASTASGANTTLSNLGATAINADLIPNADQTLALGSDTLAWNALFVNGIAPPGSNIFVLDVANAVLSDLSGSPSVRINDRQLVIGGDVKVNWSDPDKIVFSRPIEFNSSSSVKTADNISGASGDLLVSTGTTTSTDVSGALTLSTGASEDGASGPITIQTGTPTATGPSGAININSGDSPDISGTVSLHSGQADASTGSGDVSIYSGDATAANINSGDVNIFSGTVSGTGIRGDLQINVADIVVQNNASRLLLPNTITAGGTTGAQTINKMSGTVNFATATSSLVVTNDRCSTSSIVFAVIRTADVSATIMNVVPGAGTFTINLGAAASAETSVGFLVIN